MNRSIADESLGTRIESYTLKFPQEVLLVQALIDGEADTIVVFKGFSSSLVRSTAYDPEVPTLPGGAKIEAIDRLKGPYTPDAPDYIEQGMSLESFTARMVENDL
ncbi:MAG: hypothetical protein AAF703_01195 [Cyanobacteria bacterium P01_D01_bin.105]